jgi:membrane-bound serine protease (ClpP class)
MVCTFFRTLILFVLFFMGHLSADIDQSLQEHIKYQAEGPNTVGYIVIDDRTSGINQSTWLYVKMALEHYRKTKPMFVILELNTPGGEVYPAQQISDALKDLDTQYDIPVVAFINNWAISAGAMLAYSTRYISIVKDASMGAAEPVLQGAEGKMESASEKINSALRADFMNRANFFGRNPFIAEAMVDKDVILVQRDGKIIKLDNDSQIITTGSTPDKIVSPKGKLLTLNAEQMMTYGVADIMLPPSKLEPITDQEKAAGKWPASKTLLFQSPFFKQIPNAVIDNYQMDWKTQFFILLAHPVVSSMLFLGMMIGFYVEMNTPGFGVAGTVAVTCLFLIILSSFSLQLANWLEVILVFAGLAIVLIELFVTPTFGLLGFVGALLFIGGLFAMMLPAIGSVSFEIDTKTFNAAGEFFMNKLTWLLGAFLLALIIIAILGRYLMPRFSAFQRFVLTGNQDGYIAGEDPTHLPVAGTAGVVYATLRPAGKVMINNTLYEAVSDGSFIEKGEKIVVLEIDGSRMIVTTQEREEGKV